jgi:hypothetical protein
VRVLVRSGRWKRLTRGVYLVNAQMYAEVPRRAVLRAALLRHGDDAAFWGVTAAEVLGIAGVVGWPGKPWVLLPFDHAKQPDPDARLRFRVPCPAETVLVDGFPVTISERMLADLVAIVGRPTGLSLLDSALHLERVDADGISRVCALAKGRRGAPRVRELAALADGRAANPLESRVRLACIDGHVPPDELQWPILDALGNVVAIADMAWTRNRRRPLVGEADGEVPHGQPDPIFRDRRRGNDLVGFAVDTVRFTWADTKTPAYISSTVRRALRADAA